MVYSSIFCLAKVNRSYPPHRETSGFSFLYYFKTNAFPNNIVHKCFPSQSITQIAKYVKRRNSKNILHQRLISPLTAFGHGSCQQSKKLHSFCGVRPAYILIHGSLGRAQAVTFIAQLLAFRYLQIGRCYNLWPTSIPTTLLHVSGHWAFPF